MQHAQTDDESEEDIVSTRNSVPTRSSSVINDVQPDTVGTLSENHTLPDSEHISDATIDEERYNITSVSSK